jgi:hypothetical protein
MVITGLADVSAGRPDTHLRVVDAIRSSGRCPSATRFPRSVEARECTSNASALATTFVDTLLGAFHSTRWGEGEGTARASEPAALGRRGWGRAGSIVAVTASNSRTKRQLWVDAWPLPDPSFEGVWKPN